MSGHSKWATIKRAKGKTDAARSKVFTKIGRELAVAVKLGGADPDSNASLRGVIAKAKAANMPNDNIQRSIKKASGELGSINYESIVYEGYGTNGVAVISYMIESKGVLDIEKTDKMDDDEMMMTALDAGADDFSVDGNVYEVLTSPENFNTVRDALEAKGYSFIRSEIDRIPNMTVDLDDEAAEKIIRMLDLFEDNDDVQNVYHNANLPESEDDDE